MWTSENRARYDRDELRYPTGVTDEENRSVERCRRLAKDWEYLSRTAIAFLQFASIRLMLRKLCNSS
jgi:hypothetical protein